MASKKIPLQGNSKGSKSAPSTATTSPVVKVDCLYRIVWEEGPIGGIDGRANGPPSPDGRDYVEIKGKSTDGSTMVECVATLHWRQLDEMDFSCVYNTKTGIFSGFEWTNKDDFGDGAGDSEENIEDVSISMKGKFSNETEGAGEKEVLDDSENPFLFVVIVFSDEDEKGIFYGKKFVDGVFERYTLSDMEKERLRLA